MGYNTMEGQSGGRIIISCKEKTGRLVCTSHYANIWEFANIKDIEKLEWYQVKGEEKVYLKHCSLCGRTHTDGTANNC